MRDILFLFQEAALADLHEKIRIAHLSWSERSPQVISFSAPTGAGKTIIMTALFEDILFGNADIAPAPDSVFIWLSDSPELNKQTRDKIESKSDKIKVRDLTTVESSFDAEYFEGGSIYFLNTQKLGTDKLLTTTSGVRQYSIWETLTNTARRIPKKFYVVIDEAHRGTNVSQQASSRAQSIMQKFIIGSPEDGLCQMPLVIGISATPQRFINLVSGNVSSTVHNVNVPPEDVRKSGLLKDRIIFRYPEIQTAADMTVFKAAAENWRMKTEHWQAYSTQQNERLVKPVFVVQVEDGDTNEATHTDLGACIDYLEEALGRKLKPGEAVHTFNDRGTLIERGLEIRQIEASKIEEDSTAIVVFFKMNLSTGWDCPRAETMMSFRRARDFTHVAQLLGRMIRTPLARRIDSDAELNNVNLYLPYFNEDTVKSVIDSLRDSEAIVPGEVGTDKELVTLKRNRTFADVFDAMNKQVTYIVDSTRKTTGLKLYIQLSRALTMDAIDLNAQKAVKNAILAMMSDEINKLKESGGFDEIAKNITGLSLEAMTVDYLVNTAEDSESAQALDVLEKDIDTRFAQAGRQLGEGLHNDYWAKNADRDHLEVKTEIIVLVSCLDVLERLNEFAERKFIDLYEKNKYAISGLPELRKSVYKRLIRTSQKPVAELWRLPSSIDFYVDDNSKTYEKHMYCDEDGTVKVALTYWEDGVLREELENGAVCWLRNLVRKNWSLTIPYEKSGIYTPMYPDLVIVRAVGTGYVFDILEPHDSSRDDNYPKAVGLAKFAEEHWDKYGRIQLIRKKRGLDGKDHFFRLDMCKAQVFSAVRSIKSNEELDKIFDEYAEAEN